MIRHCFTVLLGLMPSPVSIAIARAQAGVRPRWERQPLNRVCGVAATRRILILAGLAESDPPDGNPVPVLAALKLEDGAMVWRHPLPAPPVPWGVIVDRDGRVVVSLENGRMICYSDGP